MGDRPPPDGDGDTDHHRRSRTVSARLRRQPRPERAVLTGGAETASMVSPTVVADVDPSSPFARTSCSDLLWQ